MPQKRREKSTKLDTRLVNQKLKSKCPRLHKKEEDNHCGISSNSCSAKHYMINFIQLGPCRVHFPCFESHEMHVIHFKLNETHFYGLTVK